MQHAAKGVSPIIATVLLIVAAIIIGTVATTWTASWVGQRTSVSSATDCTLTTSFSVPSLTYDRFNGAIGGTGAGSALYGRLTNTGTGTIGNFTAEIEYNNGTLGRQIAALPAASTNLTAGQSSGLNISIGDNVSNITSVRLFANTCKSYAITIKTIY